jgi:pimeloyl-ACP methyl ester carboxylesterase
VNVSTERLDADGVTIAASYAAGSDASAPLLVCIPGGGYNRHYFDLPGSSLLARASTQGFAALALDRPGYGDSDPLVLEEGWFPEQARLVDAAIADAWRRLGGGRPGVVLVGHSFGATVALRVAARQPSWPLLGVAVNGTLDETVASMQGLAAAIADVPALVPMALDDDQLRGFFYGPTGTFDPEQFEAARVAVAPAPAIEIREWASGWPRDVAQVTAAISVPVQIRVAEHDVVQDVSAASLARFRERFTAAPATDAAITPGTGHNTDHHRIAPVLHEEQLAFARGCG